MLAEVFRGEQEDGLAGMYLSSSFLSSQLINDIDFEAWRKHTCKLRRRAAAHGEEKRIARATEEFPDTWAEYFFPTRAPFADP